MTVKEVLNYYKSAYQFHKKTKMSITNIHNWRKQGFIPMCSQGKLEVITKGELKARVKDLQTNEL